MQPAFRVASENVCRDRLSVETISGTRRMHIYTGTKKKWENQLDIACASSEQNFECHLRFQSAVDAFVIFECVGTMETLLACTASVSAFATMDQSMLIVDTSRQKCLIAHVALVRPTGNDWKMVKHYLVENRFFFCMNNSPLSGMAFANVIVEIGTDGEATITAGTGALEWFDACAWTIEF